MAIGCGIWAIVAGCAAASPAAPIVRVDRCVEALRAVGPEGAGHREAAAAWSELVQAEASLLPRIMAGLDGAGPLAANWIRTAVDAIAERQLRQGGVLPAVELEKFVLDRRHAGRARRLAYEWLLRVDPTARQRLLPGMLDDSSPELRRDAVALRLDQAARLVQHQQADQAVALYQQALAAARDHDQIDLAAKRLRELGRPVNLALQLGYVVRWKLIGPFDNKAGKGFEAVYAPEQELRFDATYPGPTGALRWVEYVCGDDYGTVDLNRGLGEKKEVVGYAAAEFVADRPLDAELRLSSDNAVKVWLNGTLLGAYPIYHAGTLPDQYVHRVRLEAGRNLILVKVGQNELTQEWARRWDFQLRLVDPSGAPLRAAAP